MGPGTRILTSGRSRRQPTPRDPPDAPGQTTQRTTRSWPGGTNPGPCLDRAWDGIFDPARQDVTYAVVEGEEASHGRPYVVASQGSVQDSPGFTFLDADGAVLRNLPITRHVGLLVPSQATHGIFRACAGANHDGLFVVA